MNYIMPPMPPSGIGMGAVSDKYPQCDFFQLFPGSVGKLELLGMKVENTIWNFAMSSELEMLIAKFNRTVYNLYTPGAADVLDWVCFSLMATLILQENMPHPDMNTENRIRNVSIWFDTHYAEKVNADRFSISNTPDPGSRKSAGFFPCTGANG